MGEDFFDSLKHTITETAEVVGKKTEDLVEIQKLRSRIRSSQHNVELDYRKLGEMIYQRFVAGEVVDEELAEVCDNIMELQNQVADYKEELASRKGQNICPACGSANPKNAAFCMHCGAELPKEEKEEDCFTAGPVTEEAEAEDAEEEVWEACTEESGEAAEEKNDSQTETNAAEEDETEENKPE